MISHLVVYRRDTAGGRHVDTLRPTPSGEVPMTPFEARRLAAELNAAADAVDPPPPNAAARTKAPMGWNWQHALVVDLREQEVCDAMIENYVLGLSHRANGDNLNARGLLTKYGKQWRVENVAAALRTMRERGALHPAEGRPTTGHHHHPPLRPQHHHQQLSLTAGA